MYAEIDAGPGNRHPHDHQHQPGPQAVPEQERQREGEYHRAVVAREGVIRRVVQERMADVFDKRTLVRE